MSGAAAPAATTAPLAREPDADLATWLAVMAGALGAFMAMLDISVVNSALPVIQGEIGASGTEGTWIATSFLVAEIVVMPLTAWMTRVFGMRGFLLGIVTLFTLFSVLCGISTTLTMMIIGRVGQGLTAGPLVPAAITIIATRLPRHQQPLGTAAVGATMILGPVLGPVIGGWLTENASWHYAFLLNVPVGIALVTLLLIGLKPERMHLSELLEADWLGIFGLLVGLGALTVVLEEGNREQWFESTMITRLSLLSALGFIMVGIGQFYARKPVIRLAILRNRAFAAVFVLAMMTGAMIFGASYSIPQFLSAVSGYNAFQSGLVVFLSGIPAGLMMFIFPVVARNVDLRIMVGSGLVLMAFACWLDSHLTANSSGSTFAVPQLMLGLGQAWAMLFLNMATVASVKPSDAADAAGLFNTARNFGGSVALALLATLQDRRLDYHHWTINSALSANDPSVQNWVSQQSAALGGGSDGMDAAFRMIDMMVMRDALVMAYNDNFVIFMVAIIVLLPLVLLLRPLPKGHHNQMAAH